MDLRARLRAFVCARGALPAVGLAASLHLLACSGELAGDGNETLKEALAAACGSGSGVVPVDPSRSLFVTDDTALANFSFEKVMDQIVATGSSTGQTALALYQQLIAQSKPGASCGVINSSNGFFPDVNRNPFSGDFANCDHERARLQTTNPFTSTTGDDYLPLALVNRFDLAPANGANCGEYRIAFGKRSGLTNPGARVLLNFEAVLPNPTPSRGLLGCLPVAQFWDQLSSNASATSRAAALANFYFKGLAGFAPVIRAQNYGMNGPGYGMNGAGQIRGNMILNIYGISDPPTAGLVEFRLSQTCNGATCSLSIASVPEENNPETGYFTSRGDNITVDHNFISVFVAQVPTLAVRTISAISMNLNYNVDYSDAMGIDDFDYDWTMWVLDHDTGNPPLLSAISAKLVSIGRSDLTPTQILDRALSQSCAGCHSISVGRNLGGGLTWPASNGFTHIDENKTLSPALTKEFLPARATNLINFINANTTAIAACPNAS